MSPVDNTSLLANRVAETTARRDRDELDLAVARLLLQFLDAQSVSLFRLLNDGNIKRVVRRAVISLEHSELGPVFVKEAQALPALVDLPAMQDCVTRNDIAQNIGPDGLVTTLFPIQGERDVIGVLVVETAAAPALRDAELVRGILRILQNHLALLEYGERDTLTGLLNRKTFEAHFEKLHQRLTDAKEKDAAASNEPSWLALIDIDKFKVINDSHGHLFGDEVLLLTSQLMKHNFRGADQLFRFGGEEFVVVLDRASEAGAQIALERLRVMIERHAFPQVGQVTISVGYTQIAPNDMSTICVERADTALYYAKSHGRNTVCHYEALIAAGDLVAKKDDSEVELF